ncbi:MAG: TonB-dependent receptor [Pseudomonadales bacterium]|nr:TonB-dependent receptor [Pseudomonadales bacterium]
MKRLAVAIATAMGTAVSAPLFAAGISGNNVEEITVFGSDNVLTGDPLSATEGYIFGPQLHLRPLSRPAEMLEFVPGLIATQHSGEGKGNQYFLRGFNLDHGTDLALKVDGLPVNMPSHAHGQGYADLNFLVPELVDHMEYRKGPYYAEVGDFGTAGSSEFAYVDRLEKGDISLTAGDDSYLRIFAGQSFDLGSGSLTLAGAGTRYDGPWKLKQDLDKNNLYLKYHQETQSGEWAISATGYENTWNSTDQIPQRAVDNGSLSPFGTIDDSDGGDTHRRSLSADWQTLGENSALTLNAYAIDYGLSLFSNFTYFMEDPVRGDQFEQSEDRRVYGFSGEYNRALMFGRRDARLTLGLQNRSDDIDVGLYKTQQRVRHATTREDDVQQSLTSAYASLDVALTQQIRGVAGLRADHFGYDVNSDLAANSGDGSDDLLSPKFSLIYSRSMQTEYFLSAGQGFHSNDARGTTITVDPVTGDPADSVDPLAKARSVELGMRTTALPNTHVAVSLFSMKLDSELVYVGDAGATEALGESKRRGIEIGALYAPAPWLLLDADLTLTKARLLGTGADDRIPNSVGRTASLGMIVNDMNGFSGGLRIRYLGEAPLIEDNSVKSNATLLLNAQASYQFNPNLSLGIEVLNLLDSDDNDITYFYESRLAGEVAPVEDIHFHPAEPRSLRVTLSARF